jgi:hypothetical protein
LPRRRVAADEIDLVGASGASTRIATRYCARCRGGPFWGRLRIVAMSKHLLIPVFALAVAAIGCSGSSSNMTGGAGKTGTAGSMGGSGGAAAGSGGAAAGSGGAAAGSDGGVAGSDAGVADPDADVAGFANGVQAPACTTDVFSPAMFCTIYIAFCGSSTPGYTTQAECMSSYAAVGAAKPAKQMCESYHLCNAAWDTGDERTLHCGHAVGAEGLCDMAI